MSEEQSKELLLEALETLDTRLSKLGFESLEIKIVGGFAFKGLGSVPESPTAFIQNRSAVLSRSTLPIFEDL